MRVRRIWIRRYGPFQRDIALDDSINVVRGPNESGKSLLVEAILKKLGDGSVPDPVVSEEPEGFIELSDGSRTWKLEGGDTLASCCEEHYSRTIRAAELRNVFVVRSGDLGFHERDDFYTHITDRLTGRRVEDIDEVKRALREAGRLTPTELDVSSSQEYRHAGTQLKQAEELKEAVSEYVEEAEAEGVTRAEAELFDAKRREEALAERLDELEAAAEAKAKRERYAELVAETETLAANCSELAELPDRADLDEIDRRLGELSEAEGRQSQLAERKGDTLGLARWSIAGSVATFGVLLAAGLSTLATIVPLLLLATGVYLWYRATAISAEITELNVREENILSDARAAGIAVEDRSSLRGRIAAIEERRAALENENQGLKAVLERELDLAAESMEEVVEQAEAELAALEADIDEQVAIEFSEGELAETEAEYDEVRARRQRLAEALEDHRRTLQEFHDRARELAFTHFVGEPLDLEITNLDALDALERRVDEFISTLEADAEASRVAHEIFEEIQEEEKEETAELFEEGSRATEIFEDVTGGRYETVTYDTEENQLMVEKSTGEVFEPEQLSDGTRDQLYLSIRVALGEQLLGGTPGFFVMDDAFLTSDARRLERQAELIDTLAADGWQIIYLSSKEDAIATLSARCENEPIELPPLE